MNLTSKNKRRKIPQSHPWRAKFSPSSRAKGGCADGWRADLRASTDQSPGSVRRRKMAP